MQKLNSHVIRKQNIKVTSLGDGFALKQNAELLARELAPRMNKLFDELAPENEWLQIEVLDINIDNLRGKEFRDELYENVLSNLREKIMVKKMQSTVYSLQDILHSVSDMTGVRIVPEHRRVFEAFIYFLVNGTLPWNYSIGSHNDFEESISDSLRKIIGESEMYQKEAQLLKQIISMPQSTARLAKQFNNIIFINVIKIVTLGSSPGSARRLTAFENLSAIILAVQNNEPLKKKFNELKIQTLLSIVNRGSVLSEDKSVVEKFTDGLNNKVLIEEIKKHLTKIFLNDVSSTSSDERTTQKTELNTPYEDETRRQLQRAEQNTRIEHKPQKEIFSREDYFKRSEGELIANAGAVIIAPFLPQLFEECNLIFENKITDTNKAIALIHYLSFGNCEYREYDVLLNKILCSADYNSDIEIIDKLSNAEMKLADDLLGSIIEYWTALKNSSRDGVREGFLQRNGKLQHQYDGWLMNVEQKTIDILLQQLPWTIGFIKLPWMKEMLRIEWI